MILSLPLSIARLLDRGVSRLYFLLENGAFLELENGLILQAEI